jgi:hypothetical protein
MISQGMMCYGADPASADARHYGRLAGLTNHKGQYEDTYGQQPWVLCLRASDPGLVKAMAQAKPGHRIEQSRLYS